MLAGGLAIAGAGFLLMFLFGHPLSYPVLAASLFMIGVGTSSLAIASAIIMLGAPQEKAGSAAAIEESMYDLGNVLGIAILGGISAGLYRQYLNIGAYADQGIDADMAAMANESLVGALEISQRIGLTALAGEASAAFSESLVTTGLIGGIIMLAAATLVYMLVSPTLDITKHQH